MILEFILNNRERSVPIQPGDKLPDTLKSLGISSVRNSDDGWGFSGSDTVLVNGVPVNAGLMLSAQAAGKEITTVEGLADTPGMTVIQASMVDAGVVQSGYNAPAAVLMIHDLLKRIPEPRREDIDDALSSLYNRATGYKQFYNAIELAVGRMKDPEYSIKLADSFRDDLDFVGKTMRKVDGRKLVKGERVFVEDRVETGSLIVKMLRSPHASAYISSIDVSAAEAVPGVEIVLTHENTPDVYFTPAGQTFPEPSPYDRRMFPKKVCHVGDRVAAVAAETEEIALKALSLIKVEYDVQTPVLSIDEAEAPDAPIIHKSEIVYEVGAPDNLDEMNRNADPRDGRIEYQFPIGADPHHNKAASVSGSIGDVEKGFAEADVILEKTYQTSQVQCTPLEPHVVYTKMDGDRLVIHASTQVPWHVRRIVARNLGISENLVKVIKERVGGGYGSKQEILLEEVCAFVTWKTGKPAYFRYTREEDFTASVTRFPMKVRVKLGAKKDGTFTAMYMDLKANTGPYGNHCLTVPMNGCSKSLPLYLCDNISFDVNVFYSNILPTGAYQGYGAPKANFALQTAVGELAAELDMDLMELVQKNRVHSGDMLEILKCLGEGREGEAAEIESCGLGPALEQGAEMIRWGEKEESTDPDIRIGKGFAMVQQGSGLPGLDQSNAILRLMTDGSVIILTGGADLGTGLDTLCVKMAAEVLRMAPARISVLSGDTDATPYDTGAFASSGSYFSGGAVKNAAEDLKRRILEASAKILGCEADSLKLERDEKIVGSAGELDFRALAHAMAAGDGPGQIIGQAVFTSDKASFPYGAHFAQVAVNTRTGAVEVQKYYALQDCGTPINPELAEGQIYGAVLKSIGHSLYEELILDEKGRCINANLRDYGVPMIGDLPADFEVKLVETDDPYGPFGAKSVSEIAVNGAAPAIANAIYDAAGIWIREWPMNPEKILRALGEI